MTTRSLSRAGALLVLVAVLLSGGCARRGDQLGAGEDVGFCDGWSEFDGLAEPRLDAPEKVVRWVEGELRILDRIDPRVKVTIERRSAPLPQEVVQRLEAVEQQLTRFRDDVRKARDAAAVRRAVADLSRSGFDRTADELTAFRGKLCPSS